MNKFIKSHETVNSGETNIKNQLLNLVKKYDSSTPRLNILNLKADPITLSAQKIK